MIALTGGSCAAGLLEKREQWHRHVDELELAICAHPEVIDLPIEHTFLPGLYVRTLRSPVGVLATTYIHKQTHPFFVMRGVVMVGTEDRNLVEVCAPFSGITQAGTRRVCYVLEEAEWTTVHSIPDEITTVEQVEDYIFEFRTLDDGTNVRDRFREALRMKALRSARENMELA